VSPSEGRRRFGLLLDLSHAGFAAVLNEAGTAALASSTRPAGTRHDDVADWTEGLLKQAGGAFTDLAWIVTGVGPGSFTGIRIAMAFAQGVALPLGLPVFGVTSFEALHLSARSAGVTPDGSRMVAVIPANTGRYYVSESLADAGALVAGDELAKRLRDISGGVGVTSGLVITPDATGDLKGLVAAAPGAFTVWAPGDGAERAWDAVAMAQRARAAKAQGRGLVRPVYLQLSAAEEKFGPADVEGATL